MRRSTSSGCASLYCNADDRGSIIQYDSEAKARQQSHLSILSFSSIEASQRSGSNGEVTWISIEERRVYNKVQHQNRKRRKRNGREAFYKLKKKIGTKEGEESVGNQSTKKEGKMSVNEWQDISIGAMRRKRVVEHGQA